MARQGARILPPAALASPSGKTTTCSSVPCGCRTQLDAEPTLLHVTVSLRDEPETVAERIRALLNISFEEQRSWQDQYAAAVHVESASPVKQD